MEIKRFTLGTYQTNCYMVYNKQGNSCVLIDPGYDADFLLDQLKNEDKKLDAILLTHGHFDHVGAVNQLADATGCRVFLCKKDADPEIGLTTGPTFYTDTYALDKVMCVSGLFFAVIHTPGHTPGSICLQAGDVIFSGDTLFAGACGRTDLPGGNYKQLLRSLKKLAKLEGDYHILPGHGEVTTLDKERELNPFMP